MVMEKKDILQNIKKIQVSFDIDKLKFDENGLIPAVVQDVITNKVLMVAYMNKEALQKTIETGTTWFFSRSRKTLWNKGETSGHYQIVHSIHVDCDEDALLVKVYQIGVACHTGNYSCFYRTLGMSETFQEEEVSCEVLPELYEAIMERKRTLPEGSYVAKKIKEGIDRILKKVGEEATEYIIAVKNKNKEEIIYELADLWFHSLIALAYEEIPLAEIFKELKRRRGNPPKKE